MHVHCLGTTGYHPSPTRHTACYYIPELSLVLDAGTGIFRIIEHLRRDPKTSIDILLSHAHLDHVVGLTFLLDALAVTDLETIRVIGESKKLDAIQKHIYSELIFPVKPPMQFVPLESRAGVLELNGATVEYFPLEHPGGSIGFVLQTQHRKIAYVTDTIARRDASYLSKIKGVDLLLHECYFSDDHQELAIKTGHSWLKAVTEVVQQVAPKQTALIHINPLAEILGNGFSITAEHKSLGMFVAEDEQAIEV